jgi:hypothetical protein
LVWFGLVWFGLVWFGLVNKVIKGEYLSLRTNNKISSRAIHNSKRLKLKLRHKLR